MFNRLHTDLFFKGVVLKIPNAMPLISSSSAFVTGTVCLRLLVIAINDVLGWLELSIISNYPLIISSKSSGVEQIKVIFGLRASP